MTPSVCLSASLMVCLFTYLCSSSSLDALDADSEGEGPSEQSRMCYAPGSQSSSRTGLPSGDELDSFETTPEQDFNISRTESLSLSSNLQLKVFWLVLIWFIVSMENMLSKSMSIWKTNDVLFTCANYFFLFSETHELIESVFLTSPTLFNLYSPHLQRLIGVSLIHHQYI